MNQNILSEKFSAKTSDFFPDVCVCCGGGVWGGYRGVWGVGVFVYGQFLPKKSRPTQLRVPSASRTVLFSFLIIWYIGMKIILRTTAFHILNIVVRKI